MHDKTQHETTCITRRLFIFVKFWRDLRSANLFYLNHIILQEVQKYTGNLGQIQLHPFSKHLWSQNPEYIQRVCKKTSYEETRAEDAQGQFSRLHFSCGCKSKWGSSRLSEACWLERKKMCTRDKSILPFLGFGAGFASDHTCIESIQTIQYMGRLKWKPC